MLEGQSAVGNTRRLVEQLHGLEVGQTPLECRLGQLRDGLEQGHGDVFADDCRQLQQAFRL
jgi:hypothetical protein